MILSKHLKALDNAAFIINEELIVQEHSSNFFDVLSFLKKDDIVNTPIHELFVEDDKIKFNQIFQAIIKRPARSIQVKFRFKKETFTWLEAQIYKCDNEKNHFYVLVRDNTESEIELSYVNFLAYHDNLTGLANIFWIEDRWSQILTDGTANDKKVFLVLLDVDEFNQINESFGQKVGDKALIAISKRLRSLLPSKSYLARWSSDKFLVVLTQQELSGIEKFKQDINNSTSSMIEIEDISFYYTLTGGYVVYPDDNLSPEELFNMAHKALLSAKEELRNEIISYHEIIEEKEESINLFNVRNHLTDAIRNKKINPCFQPQVDSQTHELIGFEALARWTHDDLGIISPNIFIPLAEKKGLISELSNHMLTKSLDFLADVDQRGLKVSLSTNISQRQLFSTELITDIDRITGLYNLKSSRIILEITESISMSNEKGIINRLHQLKNKGFIISIDDFGTRYSSLSRLHSMPVSELKIDISFVRRIKTNNGREIVKAIADLAKALNLKTVAEGVEDQETAFILRDIGVNILQGYYFSKPLTYEEAMVYCERSKDFLEIA